MQDESLEEENEEVAEEVAEEVTVESFDVPAPKKMNRHERRKAAHKFGGDTKNKGQKASKVRRKIAKASKAKNRR